MPFLLKQKCTSSSLLELKLYQRLWVRYFIQSRKYLGKRLEQRYYGDYASYQKVYNALVCLENNMPELNIPQDINIEIINEFAMEVAYHLVQASLTRPIPLDNFQYDSHSTNHLLKSLVSVHKDLFIAGETPPSELPKEYFTEASWREKFKHMEEEIWLNFLIYIVKTYFSSESSSIFLITTVGYLYRSIYDSSHAFDTPLNDDERQKVGDAISSVPDADKIDSIIKLKQIVKKCLQVLMGESNVSSERCDYFISQAVSYSVSILFDIDKSMIDKCNAEHERWIEDYFHNSTNIIQKAENDLFSNLRMNSLWEVVIPIRTTMKIPLDCSALGFTINNLPPISNSSTSIEPHICYVYFKKIPSFNSETAKRLSYNKLNAFLSGIAYQLGQNFNCEFLGMTYSKFEDTDKWSISTEGTLYPAHFIEKDVFTQCDNWISKLLDESESNDNELANRSLEGLKLYRQAQSTLDIQYRFTYYWLIIDLFLQNTNNPENDLPLYLLMYSTKDDPIISDAKYIDFQKTRLEKFKKDTKIFWKIRNNGGVHHGKFPRWEERSLNLWCQKLEEVVELVLRYSIKTALSSSSPKTVKSCLDDIRNKLKKGGII